MEREYSGLFGDRFIQVRNRSTCAPQEKNPKGEIHETWECSASTTRAKRVVFRQFHTEGFVNQYILDADAKPERLVFTTEAIENIALGWRARETYVLVDRVEFEEVFEFAAPGKEFEPYSRARFRRVK